MKRISIILAALVLVLSTPKASAFVGGPFDNGDFNALLDNSGVYQAVFRFSNGSGFAQFGNNVDPDIFLNTAGAGAVTAPVSTYSILNRSIIYYKGVTYLGTCTGMVSHEAKLVQGVTNGTSDLSTQQTTTGPGGATNTTDLISNGDLNFTANSSFVCKITSSHPVLKFKGKGELTILNPSLAQSILTSLQTTVTSTTAAPPTPGVISAPGTAGTAAAPVQPSNTLIQQYANALTNLQNATSDLIPSAQQVRNNSDRVKMNVFGSRIFFVSRR